MKKALLSLMAFGMLLTGCSSKKESTDLLETIKEKGEIIVAMEGQWAPWTYHDENDKLVGFDTEVSAAIAKELGVKVVYREGKWDGLFSGLDSSRYDMVVNGVEYTEERAEKYDFSTPYGFMHTVLVTKKDNNTIKSFEDLKGKKTANSVSSTYETLAQSYGAKNQPVDTIDETMDMVKSGRVDATLNADVSYQDYINVHKDAPLKVVATTDDASKVVITMRKGKETENLRKAVDEAIVKLQKDGTIAKISKKYFGIDISK